MANGIVNKILWRSPSTDQGLTPLFLKAWAVIMETGGYISHEAIIARKYGIPTVINVPGVMKAIQDGRIVTDVINKKKSRTPSYGKWTSKI